MYERMRDGGQNEMNMAKMNEEQKKNKSTPAKH